MTSLPSCAQPVRPSAPDARFVHIGLTSSDVVDTALALQATAATDMLLAGLNRLVAIVGRQAVAYRETVMIGRTHGMHAEPTTFGLQAGCLV